MFSVLLYMWPVVCCESLSVASFHSVQCIVLFFSYSVFIHFFYFLSFLWLSLLHSPKLLLLPLLFLFLLFFPFSCPFHFLPISCILSLLFFSFFPLPSLLQSSRLFMLLAFFSFPFVLFPFLSFPQLSFLSSSSSSALEEHSDMYMMVPKPLDSFNLLRVKGKGLKQKVLHASCEWYASLIGNPFRSFTLCTVISSLDQIVTFFSFSGLVSWFSFPTVHVEITLMT